MTPAWFLSKYETPPQKNAKNEKIVRVNYGEFQFQW